MIFKFENFQSFGGRDDVYYNASKKFDFETTTEKSFFQPFDIIGASVGEEDYLIFIIQNTDQESEGYKIGQLDEETNKLSEFNSIVMGKIDENWEAPEETFILAEKSADRDDNSQNNLVIAVVVGVLVVAGLLIVAYLFL